MSIKMMMMSRAVLLSGSCQTKHFLSPRKEIEFFLPTFTMFLSSFLLFAWLVFQQRKCTLSPTICSPSPPPPNSITTIPLYFALSTYSYSSLTRRTCPGNRKVTQKYPLPFSIAKSVSSSSLQDVNFITLAHLSILIPLSLSLTQFLLHSFHSNLLWVMDA